jgi:hypothetical protein
MRLLPIILLESRAKESSSYFFTTGDLLLSLKLEFFRGYYGIVPNGCCLLLTDLKRADEPLAVLGSTSVLNRELLVGTVYDPISFVSYFVAFTGLSFN